MPFIDPEPHRCVGHVIGNGHCVALVRESADAPHTARWRPGQMVLDNANIKPGTAIATFDPDGRYGNHTDGRSHAAIFVGHEDQGIRVIDQWKGRATAPRLIGNRRGQGPAVDDASQYFIVEDEV
jgi:hypothetical protein